MAGSKAVGLDLLRASAAFTVLLVHLRGSSWVEYAALPHQQQTALVSAFFLMTRIGNEAVLAFFVLSGFLVGGKLISRVADRSFDLHAYAIDRATRILIPLVPACLLSAGVAAYVGAPEPLLRVLGNMLGLNGILVRHMVFNAPLWSLSFEIWFYVAAGAMACLVSKRNTWLAAAVLAISLLAFSRMGALNAMFWMLGATSILLVEAKRPFVAFVVGAVIAVIGIGLVELATASHAFSAPLFLHPIGQALVCAGVCACLPLLCSEEADRILQSVSPAASGLSAFSYTLYLTHFPVNLLLDRYLPKASEIDGGSMSMFGLRIAICAFVAVAFYFAFERNTPAIRRRLSRALRSHRMALTVRNDAAGAGEGTGGRTRTGHPGRAT